MQYGRGGSQQPAGPKDPQAKIQCFPKFNNQEIEQIL